jgi:nucleoside-diphosphate-sugar epimerase
MNKNIKIAVLGGGGKTGKYLVNHLIDKGYSLKILLRNIPQTDKTSIDQFSLNLKNPHVEIVRGDAVEYEAIHRLLSGCEAVISTIGQRPGEPMVASNATKNILRSMKEYAIRRYILVAGVNLDTPFDRKSEQVKAATAWMKSNFPIIHEDRAKAYEMLVRSHVDWTLVRLPVIDYTDEHFPFKANLEDCPGRKISTADISDFLEKQLFDTTYFRQAPFLYNV